MVLTLPFLAKEGTPSACTLAQEGFAGPSFWLRPDKGEALVVPQLQGSQEVVSALHLTALSHPGS